MNVTLSIPDSIMADLQGIATAEGFANPKAMFIHWLKAKVVSYRKSAAARVAEAAVDVTDAEQIA